MKKGILHFRNTPTFPQYVRSHERKQNRSTILGTLVCKTPELQLMVYGEGIGNATVSVNYPGVSLSSTVKLESNNYLLVYLRLDKNVKPGKMPLTFTQGKKKFVKEYELKERAKKRLRAQRFRCIRRTLSVNARPFCQRQPGQRPNSRHGRI